MTRARAPGAPSEPAAETTPRVLWPGKVTDPYGNALASLTDAERADPRIQAAASRHDDVHPCGTYEDDLLVAREMLRAASSDDRAALRAALDSQEFYEVMQAYRHSPLTDQQSVVLAFEQVKQFVLARYITALAEVARSARP